MTDNTFSQNSLVLPVDAEHGGIRAAGCVTLLAVIIVTMVLFGVFAPDLLLLGLFVGVLLGAIATNIIDRQLKGKWASGRELHLSTSQIGLRKNSQGEGILDPQKQVNPLFWYFEVTRNTRVKKGWYVIGLGLEQNDVFITLYTFTPPENFETLPFYKSFTRLQKKEGDDLKQAGIQRRLILAETHRHNDGAEVNPEQFSEVILFLQQNFPKWMPKN